MGLAYQRSTPLSASQCRSALLYALDHQETVQMAPGWIHAPHVVNGHVDDSGIQLYHASMANDGAVCLRASIVPNGGGSSIVGEFRFGRGDLVAMVFVRWIFTLLLAGMSAFVAIGILRDDQADFSAGSVAFILVLGLGAILLQPWLRRFARISDEDTKIVRDFIERAMLMGGESGEGAFRLKK